MPIGALDTHPQIYEHNRVTEPVRGWESIKKWWQSLNRIRPAFDIHTTDLRLIYGTPST